MRPAPTKSTTARAISLITSKPRSRLTRASPVMPRPPSRNDSFKLSFRACHAGANPNRTPVPIETTNVNSNAQRSTLTPSSRGMSFGIRPSSNCTPQVASSNPINPPNVDRRTLSVSIWRISLHRPPNRNFTIARRRAGHHQIRYVRASDQQNEPHRDQQDNQCLLVITDNLCAQGHEHDAGSGVRVGVLFGKAFGDSIQFGLGLFRRHAIS